MELISTTAGQGKTSQAIGIASALTGYTLFVCTSESSEVIQSHIKDLPLAGKVIISQLHTVASVKTAIIGYAAQGIDFENVVLDVDHVISHADWFKLALDLEEAGVYVVGTQQLHRTSVKSKETLTIRSK